MHAVPRIQTALHASLNWAAACVTTKTKCGLLLTSEGAN